RLDRRAPARGGLLVCRQSQPYGGEGPASRAHRKGAGRIPRQGQPIVIRQENTAMETQRQRATAPEPRLTAVDKIQKLRALFADAPELGKRALENVIKELSEQVSEPPPPIESAGRVGARLGK